MKTKSVLIMVALVFLWVSFFGCASTLLTEKGRQTRDLDLGLRESFKKGEDLKQFNNCMSYGLSAEFCAQQFGIDLQEQQPEFGVSRVSVNNETRTNTKTIFQTKEKNIAVVQTAAPVKPKRKYLNIGASPQNTARMLAYDEEVVVLPEDLEVIIKDRKGKLIPGWLEGNNVKHAVVVGRQDHIPRWVKSCGNDIVNIVPKQEVKKPLVASDETPQEVYRLEQTLHTEQDVARSYTQPYVPNMGEAYHDSPDGSWAGDFNRVLRGTLPVAVGAAGYALGQNLRRPNVSTESTNIQQQGGGASTTNNNSAGSTSTAYGGQGGVGGNPTAYGGEGGTGYGGEGGTGGNPVSYGGTSSAVSGSEANSNLSDFNVSSESGGDSDCKKKKKEH